MIWTSNNLVIQLLAGILGAHVAATVAREYSLGLLGHTLVGTVGGAFSGYFFQTLAATVVTGSGSLNEPTVAENAVLQGLTGMAAGAGLMLVIGFVRHAIADHTSQNDPRP